MLTCSPEDGILLVAAVEMACSIGIHKERAAASTRLLYADAEVRPLLNYLRITSQADGGSSFGNPYVIN